AFAVLAVAGHRAVTPHARLRFGDEAPGFDGPASDVLEHARHHAEQLEQLSRRLAEASGVDAATIAGMLRERRRVTVEEARRMGFVDEVATPEAKVLRFPRRVGYRPR
ncbi:MAG TPA: ATP-dependent Clp protease proteolytic subunit, partial [Acidimicrobiales bacterium]